MHTNTHIRSLKSRLTCELISDGFTLEQANAILPWGDDLERLFLIDVINSKYNF